MFRKLSAMIALMAVFLVTSASAGEPLKCLFQLPGPIDCVGRWCCDDYCPKKAPCVCVPLCFTCDDYCKKCEPCTNVCFGSCCDNYCKKCPPVVCSRPACTAGRGMCGDTMCDGFAMIETQPINLRPQSTPAAALPTGNPVLPCSTSGTPDGASSIEKIQMPVKTDGLLPVRIEDLPSSQIDKGL